MTIFEISILIHLLILLLIYGLYTLDDYHHTLWVSKAVKGLDQYDKQLYFIFTTSLYYIAISSLIWLVE